MDVADVFDYWSTDPPVHEMVAAYFQLKGRRGGETAKKPTLSDLQAELNRINGG